jgi:methyl-accepting chemotaxis protein
MTLLMHLRIRTRLLLLLVFTLMALTVLGGFAFFKIKQSSNLAAEFIDVEFASVGAISAIRTSLGNARRLEKDIFLTMGDENETELFTKAWNAEVKAILEALKAAEGVVHREEVALLDGMRQGVNAYATGFRQILGQMARGELNDPWAANKAMAPLKEEVRKLDQSLENLEHIVQARAEKSRTSFKVVASRDPWLIASTAMVVSVVATLLVLAINRSIIVPIQELQVTSKAWGQGDLSSQLHVTGSDELAHVKRDLNHMHAALVTLVEQVRQGVDVVDSNTHEIAHANTDLSERTEQASIALQKAATSIDQLSLTVRHTAKSAAEAVQLSQQATSVASRGGEVVSKVVSTMSDINTSSHQISDIISVIDGIAFQTNILALNAAVEAARAGDQGRGFAVVASEVRSLAGRSAQAAREIKGIIDQSVSKVEAGSLLVSEAGQTMQGIVESVGRVFGVINDIRRAAEEQREGIDLISASMNGLDQATQQNAAMVEESAAGALALADETRHLRGALSGFKMVDAPGGVRRIENQS